MRELRKQQTDPEYVEPNELLLKKFQGVAVKETTLEKFVAFLGDKKLATSRFMEPQKFSGISAVASSFESDFEMKDNFRYMTVEEPNNKYTLNIAKQGTSLISPVALFKKSLMTNIKAKARLIINEKSAIDPDEIEKMKVLNLIEELQEDLNTHHQI